MRKSTRILLGPAQEKRLVYGAAAAWKDNE